MSKTILIADDENDLREILATEFKELNYHVLTAASGEEAYRLYQQVYIDVVISDIRMPNGDGLQFLDRIFANKKATQSSLPKVIMLTGFSDVETKEVLARGAYQVVTKPFDLDHLIEIVRGALQ